MVFCFHGTESTLGAEQVPDSAGETEEEERAEGRAERRRRERRVFISGPALPGPQPRPRLQSE